MCAPGSVWCIRMAMSACGGTVASGAEILAGGSVHVYGTLRGRASAGEGGGPAQIFCHRLEAEVLAINGIVLAADDMDPRFLGRAARAVR